MKIKQYIPGFVSLDKGPVEEEFEDLSGLLGIPFVAAFREPLDFDHFAISPYQGGWLLIAMYDGGQNWWVVGRINELSQKLQDDMIRWQKPEQ